MRLVRRAVRELSALLDFSPRLGLQGNQPPRAFPPRSRSAPLSPEDYTRLVKRADARAFGTNPPPLLAGSNATVAAGGANSPTQPDHRPRPISPATPWPTWKPDYSARSPSQKMNCAP